VHLGSLSPCGARPLLTGTAVMVLQPWQSKDTAEVRFVGNGGSSPSNKGSLRVCGGKARHPSRWGSSVPPDPGFAIPPRHKLSR